MSKGKKIGIIFITLIFGGLILSKPIFGLFRNTDTLINKIGCRIFEFNKIQVKIEGDIKLDNIEIKKGNTVVFSNGKQINKVGQEYGHTLLDIYHNDTLISEIGNWNRNNWYTNDYDIFISKNANSLEVNYTIVGPDGKNDNFQKRYVRDQEGNLLRIDYITESGKIYNVEIKRKDVPSNQVNLLD